MDDFLDALHWNRRCRRGLSMIIDPSGKTLHMDAMLPFFQKLPFADVQEITFSKANEQHLKDCRDALCRSTLGDRYFSSSGSAEEAILEGIRQENLYVAFIGEECVGFTYIIPKGAFHSFPYLHIIAVKEEYRNKGIGKALLDYSENIVCEMADRILFVGVTEQSSLYPYKNEYRNKLEKSI